MELILSGLGEAVRLLLALDPRVTSAAGASLVVSGTATALSVLVGLPLGVLLGTRGFPGRRLALSLVNTGMGLPPVAVGLFVAVLVWRSGPFGQLDWYCTRQAMVGAQFLLAAPTVAALTAVAVQSVDPLLRVQIAALGATQLQSAWLLVRETRLLLFSAAIAGFGAVISEVGASLMTGCNIVDDTRILTTAIVVETGRGEFGTAFALSFILLAIIFALTALVTFAQHRRTRLP